MSMPGAQTITVRHEGTERVFETGQQITVGRAPDVLVSVDNPLVSRVHATVAWRGNGWVLADNASTNGVFVDARRLGQPVVIDRPMRVRLGDANTGPLLQLLPTPMPDAVTERVTRPSQEQLPTQRGPGRLETQQPTVMTVRGDVSALPPVRARSAAAQLARTDRLPPGGLSIGRTSDNQIVVNDPLASREHARLVATAAGLTIEDLGSANGTFINGHRRQRSVLAERDVVTIGNVDFAVAHGALVLREKPATEQGLHVHGVGYTVAGNKQLLIDVNVQASQGSLTALIGPSGAGKSTLAKLIAGAIAPTAGVVTFEGRNLHAEYEALRSRIGMVPQDDVLHRQLTVRQALGFAAELRLPPDHSPADRHAVIDGVLTELSLSEHADTRIDQLSGGQRKRASVALELLTGPSLLILDEPTSGLDPALDRQVMMTLRALADAGRVVIVVTHSVACLDMCDEVLLLAPGGKTAYCGHPAGVGAALGTSNWAEIFAEVATNPELAFAAHRSRQANATPAPPPPRYGPSGRPPQSGRGKQFSTLARRQLRLILADRSYLAFLVIMPFVLAGVALMIPGGNGFAPGALVATADGAFVPSGGGETQALLVVLVLSACLMGVAMTARDLVGERTIFYRERAVGLMPSAYLLAKIAVFSMFAAVQSAVLVAVTLVVKKAPGAGSLIPSGSIELYVGVALTAVCCVVFGLLLSALAKSNEQVMPMLVAMFMVQLLMAGGMIPVTDRMGLEQLSWLFPSRWGYASTASTVDIRQLFTDAQPDRLWEHTGGTWIRDIGMLVLIAMVLAALTWYRLRLKKSVG